MRFLIVDDNKAMRMMVRRAQSHAGYGDAQFDEASNGVEALAAITADAPDLVLSDWDMPEMNGMELLRSLRDAGIDVTFGFVAAETHPALRERALLTGARFFIYKPTDDGTLLALAIADAGFACRTGAALAMVPSVVADEAVRADEIPETLLENAREVIDITARLINSAYTPHLRLAGIHVVPGELPDDVAALVAAPARRRDFAINIDGYGDGRLALLIG